MKVYYDENARLDVLEGETVAVVGYGIQGRAQALNLRDSGIRVVVGNRDDPYRKQALADGMEVREIAEAARMGSLVVMHLPDEVQPQVHRSEIAPSVSAGDGLVFAHGFCVHYGLIEPIAGVDQMMLAPRMPGLFVRHRYRTGWGVPAFVAVREPASERAWPRLLGLAKALGVTRCGAVASSFQEETELKHFSQHFTYPIIFRTLEVAFEALIEAGHAPEKALMELHGSEDMGQVLLEAARKGLFGMLDANASPASQVGLSHYWEELGDEPPRLARAAIDRIRNGVFAEHLRDEQSKGYPELKAWRAERSRILADTESKLHRALRPRAQKRTAG